MDSFAGSAIGPGIHPAITGPGRIVFGLGQFAEVGTLASAHGRRALVVTGATRRHADRLQSLLAVHGVATAIFSFAGEPAVATVLAGLEAARRFKADLVLGLGGGSALDAAKAIAGFLGNPGDPMEYLEVVGGGRTLGLAAAPWIAIPTTAGTGAEVTRNAVLTAPENGLKVSLRSPHLFARVALVDPELTFDSPPAVTAACGMDALTQLIEPYVCNRPNPATDALCAAGIPRAARALPRLRVAPGDPDARASLALAALWSGQALTNAGLGAVHGLAAPIGGMSPAPHGAVCAGLLAPVMQKNISALRLRAPAHPALARYSEIATWLTGDPSATADAGCAWTTALVRQLGIPSLATFGLTEAQVPEIVARAKNASSMKANPVALTDDELREILVAALH